MGIDVVVHTDVGDIPVQVKSSPRAVEKFLKRRGYNPKLAIVIVGDNPDPQVRVALEQELTRIRALLTP